MLSSPSINYTGTPTHHPPTQHPRAYARAHAHAHSKVPQGMESDKIQRFTIRFLSMTLVACSAAFDGDNGCHKTNG